MQFNITVETNNTQDTRKLHYELKVQKNYKRVDWYNTVRAGTIF